MIVFVRFSSEISVDAATIEEAVQGVVGRDGSVIGASDTSIDVEVTSSMRPMLEALAAALRDLGLPPTTELDIPAAGQRYSILDF